MTQKLTRVTSVILLVAACSIVTNAQQTLATIEVELSHPALSICKVNLDPITVLHDTLLSLVEVQRGQKIPVAYQIDNSKNTRELCWIVEGSNKNAAKKTFQLIKAEKTVATNTKTIDITTHDGALIIRSDNKNLLQYNYKVVAPPAGVDASYGRSGFIHPLWSPKGQVLTRIQPPDHYHHYGIWNPWTHLLYDGDTLDLWNLNRKQGTVRFANFTGTKAGPVFGEYSALHEHVAFRKSGEEVMMNEVQTVRVYQPANANYYIADITMEMSPVSKPVLLLEYRYGGLGWRTTEQWTKDNSEVLTSESKTRKDADGTKARWCLVQGLVDRDTAGVLMMSYPTNYNYPEPLRIWPENQYNRGDMFANFDPTKNMDWLLEKDKTYVLRYRLIVFTGKLNKLKSESAWQSFANPPRVTVTMAKK